MTELQIALMAVGLTCVVISFFISLYLIAKRNLVLEKQHQVRYISAILGLLIPGGVLVIVSVIL